MAGGWNHRRKKYADPTDALAAKAYACTKYRAKIKSYAWGLTIEHFLALSAQPCHYCALPPSNRFKHRAYPNAVWNYSGIDRMDNTKGYHVWNIVACCGRCNMVKGVELSYEEMLAVGKVLKRLRRA